FNPVKCCLADSRPNWQQQICAAHDARKMPASSRVAQSHRCLKSFCTSCACLSPEGADAAFDAALQNFKEGTFACRESLLCHSIVKLRDNLVAVFIAPDGRERAYHSTRTNHVRPSIWQPQEFFYLLLTPADPNFVTTCT